jgi:hypothetical protein
MNGTVNSPLFLLTRKNTPPKAKSQAKKKKARKEGSNAYPGNRKSRISRYQNRPKDLGS